MWCVVWRVVHGVVCVLTSRNVLLETLEQNTTKHYNEQQNTYTQTHNKYQKSCFVVVARLTVVKITGITAVALFPRIRPWTEYRRYIGLSISWEKIGLFDWNMPLPRLVSIF